MYLKEDIYKKLKFSPKKWQSPKILSLTLLGAFFTNLRMIFGIPTKLRIYWYPWRPIFSNNKKFTLWRGFCHFFKTKIAITMRILKIEKSVFSTLVLEFDLNPNVYSAFLNFEKSQNLAHPTVQLSIHYFMSYQPCDIDSSGK